MNTADFEEFDWQDGEYMGPPPPPPPPDDVPSSTASAAFAHIPASAAFAHIPASAAAGGLPSDILEMVDRAIVYAGNRSAKVAVLCSHVKGSSWAEKPLEDLIPIVEHWHSRIPDEWKRGDMKFCEDVVVRFFEMYPETRYAAGRNTKSEVTEKAAEMLERGDLPEVARKFQDPVKQAVATLCWVWQRTVCELNGGSGDVPFGLGARDLAEFIYRKELAEIGGEKERVKFLDANKDIPWNILSRIFTKPPYAIVQLVEKGTPWQKGIRARSTTWIMPSAIPGLGE